jgi:predicted enzyme related to lactoylglutathione lyase
VAKDPDRLERFYRELFGWTITSKNALGYRQVSTGEGSINGGLWPSPPEGHSFVQLFVGVPDVESAVKRAAELGATIIMPPMTLPDGDTMAVLADPCGVTFGVMRISDRDASA